MNNSITEDFKTWKNYPNGSCELFGELGKPLVKFDGEIIAIGGYLYVYENEWLHDISLNEGEFVLEKHTGKFPMLIRKKVE